MHFIIYYIRISSHCVYSIYILFQNRENAKVLSVPVQQEHLVKIKNCQKERDESMADYTEEQISNFYNLIIETLEIMYTNVWQGYTAATKVS